MMSIVELSEGETSFILIAALNIPEVVDSVTYTTCQTFLNSVQVLKGEICYNPQVGLQFT
jgi:hypothetical protein